MKIEISGISEMDKALAGINADMDGVIEKAANVVAEEARRMCPVDTGALRDSISVTSEGAGARISADEDYAAFVEFGTYKAAAQPFLVPALLISADAVADIVRNEIFKPEV